LHAPPDPNATAAGRRKLLSEKREHPSYWPVRMRQKLKIASCCLLVASNHNRRQSTPRSSMRRGGRDQARTLWPRHESDWASGTDDTIHAVNRSMAPAEDVPDDPELTCRPVWKRHGTLSKRLAGEQARWARRVVSVDDVKGRLCYARKHPFPQAGSRKLFALPLADVTRVRALPPCTPGMPTSHSFEVSCAPHRLVLCVETEAELDHWVGSLQRRASFWRKKTDEKGLRARPTFERDPQGQPWHFEPCRPAW
jgi:hypothetical protein